MNKSSKKTYEVRYQELLYSRLWGMNSDLTRAIAETKKIAEVVEINANIPNTAIACHNKISELIQIFKKAGISLLVEQNGTEGYVEPSFVGTAIIEDMMEQVAESADTLTRFLENVQKAIDKKIAEYEKIQNYGLIRRLSLSIRAVFNPNIISDLDSYSEEELQEVNANLLEYLERDKKIRDYNLRDDIIQSITIYIGSRQYTKEAIDETLEKNIIPALQKLGLDDIVPALKETLEKLKTEKRNTEKDSWELSTLDQIRMQITMNDIIGAIAKESSVLNGEMPKPPVLQEEK